MGRRMAIAAAHSTATSQGDSVHAETWTVGQAVPVEQERQRSIAATTATTVTRGATANVRLAAAQVDDGGTRRAGQAGVGGMQA